MHAVQFFLGLLGLALTSLNCEARSLPHLQIRADTSVRAPDRVNITNFLISDISSKASTLDGGASSNHTFSFLFADTNSNTSTTCEQTWTDAANSTANAPFSLVLCDDTGNENQEHFQWQFETITSPESFQINFIHGFNDPLNYPPPFSYIHYGSETLVNLVCKSNKRRGTTNCSLPANQTSLVASINSIS